MRWALAALMLACGCLHDDLVHCANGIACPVDLVCDDVHATCVEPDQLASCDGKADLTECLDGGACHEGVCLPVGCGNARRDPGETCDDGNTASADGCSADCGSTETCGNGQVDPVNRELCDQGDLVNHDGCDSRCALEEPDWTPYVQLAAHPSREQAAFAYDSARDRLVVFGGFSDVGLTRVATTFEWDGARRTWLDRTPDISPTARAGAGLAYDAARGNSVLFGGTDVGGNIADTWLWDGERWTLAGTSSGPSARVYPAMAYDAKRERVILFGGRGAGGIDLADTWSWDGTTWTELHPATIPNKRERAMIAFDPRRAEIMMVAGVDVVGRKDVWMFDGTDWRQAPDTNELRFGSVLVWNPSRDGMMLLGGAMNPDLFWNGTAWSIEPTSPHVSRSYGVGYYDPRFDGVVVGLGFRSSTNVMLTDMHAYTSGAWSAVSPSLTPSGAGPQAPMMAYDVLRARVVMFGGNPGSGDTGDTFELERGAWVNRLVTGPPPRDRGASAYDVARGRLVVWGGHATDALVWEWDGTTWTSIAPVGPAPTLRQVSAMTYVPGVGCVLMGGETAPTVPIDDTWIWDGTAWTDITSAGTPGLRAGHAMAYDPERHELVLFGGANGSTRLGDTWTWTMENGWMQRTPPTSPAGRSRGAMVWDPARRRMLLVGGLIGTARLDEVWAWDGTTWSRQFTNHRIANGLVEPGVAYDPGEGAVVAESIDGLFRFQWRGDGTDDACETASDRDRDGLAGCADPDCWALCAPLCPFATSCAAPSCGDGTCDARETCRACPADCGACPVVCGDAHCDGESASCPGDCP